jgi:hypothetical protein
VELVLFSKRNRTISRLSLAANVLLLLEVLKHLEQVPDHNGLGLIVEVELSHFLRLVPLVVPRKGPRVRKYPPLK